MNERIKSMPWDVKAAIVFLILLYVVLCFMAPAIWGTLTVVAGTILSIARVIHYLSNGK